MWIRKLRERGESGSSQVNVLWKDDDLPLYLMDNHRAALWCWREHLARAEAYGIVHLDWHWDGALVEGPDLVELERCWPSLDDFDDFDLLPSLCRRKGLAPSALVRWDNYIDPFLKLYPGLSVAHVTALQDPSSGYRAAWEPSLKDRRTVSHSLEGFFGQIASELQAAAVPLIVNVDLDYFFTWFDGAERLAFDREFVRGFFRLLAQHRTKTKVMTIALSPDCCGGWGPSEEIAKVAFEGLGIPWPLPASP